MPGAGKDKNADLGLCQDGSESNKRGQTQQYCSPQLGGWIVPFNTSFYEE